MYKVEFSKSFQNKDKETNTSEERQEENNKLKILTLTKVDKEMRK